MLCFIGHALMENRSGLIVQADLTRADGHAERRAALSMIHAHSPGSTRLLTLGADRGYDSADFVRDLRHAPCRAEIPTFRDRRPHDPAQGLRPVPEAQKAGRGAFRLGKERWRPYPDCLPRRRTGRRPLCPDDGRQQPRSAAPVAGRVTDSGKPDHDARGSDRRPRPCQPPKIGKPFRFGD
jgi:hypothetical protein